MKKLQQMTKLTISDLSKIAGGNTQVIQTEASTCWNTAGCTDVGSSEGYDSCGDDDED